MNFSFSHHVILPRYTNNSGLPSATAIWLKPLFAPCELPLGNLVWCHLPNNSRRGKHGGPKLISKENKQINPKSLINCLVFHCAVMNIESFYHDRQNYDVTCQPIHGSADNKPHISRCIGTIVLHWSWKITIEIPYRMSYQYITRCDFYTILAI